MMTKEEYEQAMGQELADDAYEVIHTIAVALEDEYMSTEDLLEARPTYEAYTPVEICLAHYIKDVQQWIELDTKQDDTLRESIKTLETRLSTVRRELHDTGLLIAEQGEELYNQGLREIAIKVLGEEEYIRWKLSNPKTYITEEDRQLIIQLLGRPF